MSTMRNAAPEVGTPQDEDVTRHMLEEHVPISLILDMSSLAGPDSESLLAEEHPDTEDWLPEGTTPEA